MFPLFGLPLRHGSPPSSCGRYQANELLDPLRDNLVVQVARCGPMSMKDPGR
jgi:hypothetical protein